MTQNKKIIGITGGSGCGKSYICEILRSRGIPVIDADKTAHEVMAAGTRCCAEISEYFGTGVGGTDGINRKKLAAIVFADPEKLKKLNEITHKYILESIINKVESENSDIVGVDGATLIESGMRCDVMIGVLADIKTRKTRIMSRDALTAEEAEARINAQPREDFYERHCDFIIRNDGGKPDIDGIMKRIGI